MSRLVKDVPNLPSPTQPLKIWCLENDSFPFYGKLPIFELFVSGRDTPLQDSPSCWSFRTARMYFWSDGPPKKKTKKRRFCNVKKKRRLNPSGKNLFRKWWCFIIAAIVHWWKLYWENLVSGGKLGIPPTKMSPFYCDITRSLDSRPKVVVWAGIDRRDDLTFLNHGSSHGSSNLRESGWWIHVFIIPKWAHSFYTLRLCLFSSELEWFKEKIRNIFKYLSKWLVDGSSFGD